MRIYLAAPFNRKDDARKAREVLRAKGHNVVANWIDNHLKDEEVTAEEMEAESKQDLRDIQDADGFVMLNLAPSTGKSIEFGYAYALRKHIWIVDARPADKRSVKSGGNWSVFYHLPKVHLVSKVEDIL